MFCKQCGSEILNDSRFCENCGATIEAAAAVSVSQPAQQVPQAQPAPQVQQVQPAQPYPAFEPVQAVPVYQPVQVTPVYPPSSIYARNASEALQAQQAVMQQPQYAPYATVNSLPQYQSPVYPQQLPGVLYDPNAAPAGSGIFLKILRIAGGVTTGIYTLLLLFSVIGDPKSGNVFGYFFALSYSLFVLIFSLCKKKLGKGAFIALVIPLGIFFYLASGVSGD